MGQRVSSALLEQFETVSYIKGTLLSADGKSQSPRTLKAPFGVLFHAVDALGKNDASRVLQSAEGVFVGAKDFRAPGGPTGLGGVDSVFCFVLLLKPNSALDLKKVAKTSATATTGTTGWTWEAPPQEGHPDKYQIYATQVGSSYLLISNSRADMERISALLLANSAPKLEGIREFDVIARYDFWGYRR
ncbi:MAG TPA: hypothetical protein VMZ25_08535, partial [Terriglobales bacterium]|nr:hypothetical protein [Terriglobales bacterium]